MAFSLFSLFTLTILAIFIQSSSSLEYPEELLDATFFDDLQPQSSVSPFDDHSSTSAYFLSPSSSDSPSPSPFPWPKLQAPALFVIGDSSVGCGNNNFLGTFARAERLPYGRDFDTHRPSGRFSNGRTPVDYLALRLDLPFVPNYLGQAHTVEEMIHGVNYASAGAGIIFSIGSDLGLHISFTHQIQQFTDTFQQLILSMGEEEATDLISNSIFYISIGTNDYMQYYFPNVSAVQSLYSPSNFSYLLSAIMKQGIENLYKSHVRKMVVMGLAPLGCSPYYLWRYKSENGDCIEDINEMIMEFNFAMKSMVEELNANHPDAIFIFCDAFEGAMDIIQNNQHYGFSVTSDACCGLGKYKGWIMCISPEMACQNASTHIWWDPFHPTDAVNQILVDNVWYGLHSSMCYPKNMKDLVSHSASSV